MSVDSRCHNFKCQSFSESLRLVLDVVYIQVFLSASFGKKWVPSHILTSHALQGSDIDIHTCRGLTFDLIK